MAKCLELCFRGNIIIINIVISVIITSGVGVESLGRITFKCYGLWLTRVAINVITNFVFFAPQYKYSYHVHMALTFKCRRSFIKCSSRISPQIAHAHLIPPGIARLQQVLQQPDIVFGLGVPLSAHVLIKYSICLTQKPKAKAAVSCGCM